MAVGHANRSSISCRVLVFILLLFISKSTTGEYYGVSFVFLPTGCDYHSISLQIYAKLCSTGTRNSTKNMSNFGICRLQYTELWNLEIGGGSYSPCFSFVLTGDIHKNFVYLRALDISKYFSQNRKRRPYHGKRFALVRRSSSMATFVSH
jgi:hypothetical protein